MDHYAGNTAPTAGLTNKLHACVDMIFCYASMMSTLRHGPEFLGTLDLLQMMEALNELLLDECHVLQEQLEERIRPDRPSQE
jgi:hypothetical protein